MKGTINNTYGHVIVSNSQLHGFYANKKAM